jgi:hypothetical protein
MSFAQNHLEKFGWKQGQGLGKHSTGSTRSIPISVKNNTSGLGKTENFGFQWWDHVYNRSTASVSVEQDEDGNAVVRKVEKSQEKKKASSLLYGSFVKAKDVFQEEDFSSKLTDAELFKACGGRTAHKGARASVIGKLSRADPDKLIQESSSEDEFEVRARAIANGVNIRDDQSQIPKEKDVRRDIQKSRQNDRSNDRQKDGERKKCERDSDKLARREARRIRREARAKKKERKYASKSLESNVSSKSNSNGRTKVKKHASKTKNNSLK